MWLEVYDFYVQSFTPKLQTSIDAFVLLAAVTPHAYVQARFRYAVWCSWILGDRSGLTVYTMNDSPQPHCSSADIISSPHPLKYTSQETH